MVPYFGWLTPASQMAEHKYGYIAFHTKLLSLFCVIYELIQAVILHDSFHHTSSNGIGMLRKASWQEIKMLVSVDSPLSTNSPGITSAIWTADTL